MRLSPTLRGETDMSPRAQVSKARVAHFAVTTMPFSISIPVENKRIQAQKPLCALCRDTSDTLTSAARSSSFPLLHHFPMFCHDSVREVPIQCGITSEPSIEFPHRFD